MNKGRGKSGRNVEGVSTVYSPFLPFPILSQFFSCSLLYAPHALSERLEQAILALEDSSVAARNKDTKTNAV